MLIGTHILFFRSFVSIMRTVCRAEYDAKVLLNLDHLLPQLLNFLMKAEL
jgi:hypothetical protein